MTTPTRPYVIRDKQDTSAQPRLVRATNPAQALRHVTRDRFTVEPASASEVLDLIEDGIKAETAGAEPATEGGQE